MFKAGLSNLKDDRYLLLGKVARPFGIKGEVRVHPFNPFSETFTRIKSLLLRSPDGNTRECQIESVRPHQDFFLIRFQGVDDRDQAEAIRDFEVLVRKDQLPAPKKGEFYWHQLLGLKAVSEDGRELGRVVALEQTNPYLSGNDILVIKADCREVLVPFTRQTVKKVDLEKGEIIISNLEDFQE